MRRIWVVVGALALVAAACTDTSGSDVISGVAAPAAQTAPEGGVAGEGIQVHGDWTITVVNPDGSVASEWEFSNALTDNGKLLLVDLLTAQRAVSGWIVDLGAAIGNANIPCQSFACFIVEPNLSNVNAESSNLQVADEGQSLGLSGSMVASVDGQVSAVGTFFASGSLISLFTRTTITPIDVLAGQEVFVTVTISFS